MNARVEADYRLIEAAAIAGERCPQTEPHGPLASNSIGHLYAAGRIRSEIYRHNFRVVTLLKGPHAGKATAGPGDGSLKPYRVNGRYVGRARGAMSAQ